MKELREQIARAIYDAATRHSSSAEVRKRWPWERATDLHDKYLAIADAALAAIEASGTHVDAREYEALTRAARAFLDHPGIASASATLRGRVEQAERILAARPRDASPTEDR